MQVSNKNLVLVTSTLVGLVHKVISQSSVMYNPWVRVSNPKSNAIKICAFLGKQLFDSEEILKFLKTVDVEVLLDAQERLRQNLVSLLL